MKDHLSNGPETDLFPTDVMVIAQAMRDWPEHVLTRLLAPWQSLDAMRDRLAAWAASGMELHGLHDPHPLADGRYRHAADATLQASALSDEGLQEVLRVLTEGNSGRLPAPTELEMIDKLAELTEGTDALADFVVALPLRATSEDQLVGHDLRRRVVIELGVCGDRRDDRKDLLAPLQRRGLWRSAGAGDLRGARPVGELDRHRGPTGAI